MAKEFSVDKAFEGRDLPERDSRWFSDTETQVCSLRFHKERQEALKQLFAARGLDFASGIRMVAYEWLRKNG